MSAASFRMKLVDLLLAIISGSIYGLAWRSHDAGPIGLIGLALFFVQQSKSNRWWTALLTSMVAGTAAYLIACSWFAFTIQYLMGGSEITANWVAVLACLLQAGHFGLFGLAWFMVRRSFTFGWTLAPLLWVAVEELWPGFFPCKVGNLLVESPSLCQIASVGGAPLVSFQAAFCAGWLALIGVWLWNGSKYQSWPISGIKLAGWGAVAIGFSFALGAERVTVLAPQPFQLGQQDSLRVLIVQVDTEYSDSVDRMIEICNQFRDKVDLFVWPECALENYPQELDDFSETRDYPDGWGLIEVILSPYPSPPASILAGGDSWIPDADALDGKLNFVSAFLINEKERIVGRHDKVHLMPYGESIPGEKWFPILGQWFGSERKILSGNSFRPIGEIKGFQIGTVLCCEDMHPGACREMVQHGADILITLGSGAAFGEIVPLRQHFRIAQMRAIENGKYFLRCTSRGISGLIAPNGQVIGILPAMQELATTLEIPTNNLPPTLFTRWGYWLGYWLIGLLSTLIVVLAPRSPSNQAINTIKNRRRSEGIEASKNRRKT